MAAILVLIFSGWAANGAEAKDQEPAEVRLIGPHSADGEFWFGLEITLAEGWKTYWRHPGDAGIPPLLIDQASTNLADFELSFPAPIRFHDAYGQYLGFENRVIYPLKIQAKDPSEAVEVKLDFRYAACREICLPLQSKLTASINPKVEKSSQRVEMALRRSAKPADPGLIRVQVSGAPDQKGAEGSSLKFTIQVDPSLGELEDFIIETLEGSPLPLPRLAGETRDQTEWAFLSALPADVLGSAKPEPLTLRATTIIYDGVIRRPFETVLTLPSQ